MENKDQTYWHIQMGKPKGREGARINSMDLLCQPQPVIATTEDPDNQCKDFKTVPEGTIVLVREGKKGIGLM